MLLFIKIIIQILTVVIALLVNNLDYKNYDKRTSKFMVRRKLLLPLTIILLIVSIASMIYDANDISQKENEQRSKIENLEELVRQQKETIEKGFDEATAQNTLVNNSPDVVLRVRAILLSKEILNFLSERRSKEPPFIMFDPEGLSKEQASLKFLQNSIENGRYSLQTSTEFIEKFGTRWENIVKELNDRGIKHRLLKESVQNINTNHFIIGDAATQLGVIALQMSE